MRFYHKLLLCSLYLLRLYVLRLADNGLSHEFTSDFDSKFSKQEWIRISVLPKYHPMCRVYHSLSPIVYIAKWKCIPLDKTSLLLKFFRRESFPVVKVFPVKVSPMLLMFFEYLLSIKRNGVLWLKEAVFWLYYFLDYKYSETLCNLSLLRALPYLN